MEGIPKVPMLTPDPRVQSGEYDQEFALRIKEVIFFFFFSKIRMDWSFYFGFLNFAQKIPLYIFSEIIINEGLIISHFQYILLHFQDDPDNFTTPILELMQLKKVREALI